jgi:hypothetical protein
MVATTEKGDILRIDLRGTQPSVDVIPVIWDDPATPQIESETPNDDVDCASLRDPARFKESAIFGAHGSRWQSIDAPRPTENRGGIAWAVGCNAAIVRIHAVAEPPYAERIGPDRSLVETNSNYNSLAAPERHDLQVVRAFAPDAAIFGAQQTNSGGFPRFWIARPVTPDDAGLLEPNVLVEVTASDPVIDGYANTPSTQQEPQLGNPFVLLGDSSWLSAVYLGTPQSTGEFSTFRPLAKGADTSTLIYRALPRAAAANGAQGAVIAFDTGLVVYRPDKK